MLEYSVTPRHLFRPESIPAALRLYDDVSDDVDLYEYGQSHRRSSLLKFGARRISRRLAFPWLLRGPWLGESTFIYRRNGAETRIRFNACNAQFGSAYSRKFAGWYEPLVSELLTMFIPRDSGVFFDIGANWGHFSLYVASVLGENVRIHAFEPFPESFQDLRSTVCQAGLESRVTTYHLALGSEEKLVSMTPRDPLETGLNEIDPNAEGGYVRCAPLDRLGLPNPDFLKIDVEGFERHVLIGAEETLATSKPYVIFESRSSNGRDQQEAIATMEFLEWRSYRLYEPIWKLTSSLGDNLSRDDRLARKTERPRLVLRGVSAVERPLLPAYVNLFGCHADRVAELSRTSNFLAELAGN